MDRSTQEMETRERKRERELADGESAGEASAGFPSCKKCVVTVQGRKPPKPGQYNSVLRLVLVD